MEWLVWVDTKSISRRLRGQVINIGHDKCMFSLENLSEELSPGWRVLIGHYIKYV